MREFFDDQMSPAAAHLARWREGLGPIGAPAGAATVRAHAGGARARGKPRRPPSDRRVRAPWLTRDPVRHLERDRAGAPDPLDGDRQAPRSLARAPRPHPLGGRAGGPRARLPGRVRGLLRRRPGAGSDWRWSRRLRARLRAAIAEAAPRLVVFDGAHPYQALIDALGRRSRHARGLVPAADVAAGLQPGRAERAAGSSTPCWSRASSPSARTAGRPWRAATRPTGSAPIVFCDDEELVPRADAERELGLEPGKVNVLVQLGQGPEVAGAVSGACAIWRGASGVQVAALSSTIARLLDGARGGRAPALDLPDEPLLRRLRLWRSRPPATTPTTS